ncbi:MAG TPA: hypothetical protein VL854_10385 [Nitrososphaeraceae archaeon]|nr:hypothetical protein [Nitrososphaeraceae archaeon]
MLGKNNRILHIVLHDAYLVHQINETNNIRVLLNSIVSEEKGEHRLEGSIIAYTQTGDQQSVPVSGLDIY